MKQVLDVRKALSVLFNQQLNLNLNKPSGMHEIYKSGLIPRLLYIHVPTVGKIFKDWMKMAVNIDENNLLFANIILNIKLLLCYMEDSSL